MKNIIRCFLVFFIAFLFAAKSVAQNMKVVVVVVVAVDESYYPYMYSAENNAKGLYVQQIAAMFRV